MVVVTFLFILLGLHIWFVNNARGVLKQIVATKSHGKIKLELSQLRFEFLSNKLQIREADLVSTDTLSQPTTYRVKFRKLTLRINSFWPLLFQKQLLLDSVKLHDPEIEVFQWRKDTSSVWARDELSISQEMGKLYNSMLDVLEGFGIRRIIINNAKLSLINKLKPGSQPITISKIYFDLVRTASGVIKRDEFVENEQSVELRTTNQDIALPGGRHRLAFQKFRLELFEKRIELDSCTLSAVATENSKSSYKIFFKKLSLVGVDFNAMYTQNLIRADSVYCENPLFDIDLNPSDAVSKKKGRPDPEKILKELTGDLDLAFVGVKDAGININISGKKPRSFFNSNNDDFEMRGFRINSDSVKPVTVQRFDMLVRDYRLYNEDSSAAYSFDSVHFVNNKVSLNNFSLVITSKNKERNKKDFNIPYFELTGLDWYQLIFEENLKAQEATLYNPVINYTKTHFNKQKKKVNIFAAFQGLDTLLALNKINIINGTIDMKLGNTTSLNFQKANIRIYSDRLLQSKNKEGLRKAVDELSFSTGVIKLKNLTIWLDNARYTDQYLVRADRLKLRSNNGHINAAMRDVAIDNILLDDRSEFLIVDGIHWKAATVSVLSLPGGGPKKNTPNIQINNVTGFDTQIDFKNGSTEISSFVKSLQLASLFKNDNAPPFSRGFSIAGNKLVINNKGTKLRAGSYAIEDIEESYISNVQLEQIKGRDSLSVNAPRISFSGSLNNLLAGRMYLTNVQAHSPVITVNKWNGVTAEEIGKKTKVIRIDEVTITEPVINVSTHRNDSVTIVNLPHSDNSLIKLHGLTLDNGEVRADRIALNATAASFVKRTGETYGVEKGKVEVKLSNVRVAKVDGKSTWNGLVNSIFLQNPNSVSLGKKKNSLTINQVSAGNLSLSSGYINNFSELLKYNVSAWLRAATGQYIDSVTTLKWYNANYNYADKTLSLDSFSYHPTQPRDSVIAHSPYQTDYITLKTGPVTMADFDLEKYKKDSALIAGVVDITNPEITVYRDKTPPFRSGVIKPLPVDMIKRIALPISIKRINFIDGFLSYTEKNAKTKTEGTILLTKLDGKISRIKNREIAFDDSLVFSLDAYLMDSALIKLRVKESYSDPLSGFLMTLRLTPTSLTFLNPVLAPLSNVKIVSGRIDSFLLRAIGKEDLALGEINMYYHDLRIKLYKNAELNQTSFGKDIASFLANTFIIRKNNNGKPGIVYFERLRDRSFFNYIVRMTFSGMAASIGVKKNKKYINEYEKQLQLKNLPPITGLDVQLKR